MKPLATVFRDSAEALERETHELWERRRAEFLDVIRASFTRSKGCS